MDAVLTKPIDLSDLEDTLRLLTGAEPIVNSVGGNTKLLARVHRASALFYLWTCVPDQAKAHAQQALEFARANGEPAEAWSAHWSLGVLSALTGDTVVSKHPGKVAGTIRDDLHCPVFSVVLG